MDIQEDRKSLFRGFGTINAAAAEQSGLPWPDDPIN